MESKARLITMGAALTALTLLAGCGADGVPITPEPNRLPAPGSGLDISGQSGDGAGAADEAVYDTSI